MTDPADKNKSDGPATNKLPGTRSAMDEPIPGAREIPAREGNEPKKLSAEEQMERFEEYLRETDCGHRPC